MKARHTLPFAALVVVACSSDPAPLAATTWTCSSATPLTNAQALALPYEHHPEMLPACTPRCGVSTCGGSCPARALPTGACDGEGACSMGVQIECKGPGRGPVHGYTCRCHDGQWSCVIGQMGGAICDGGPVD